MVLYLTMPSRNQQQANDRWQQTFPSNIGEITLLVPPARENTGLRKPYQYKLSIAKGRQLIKNLKVAVAPFAPFKLQCTLIDSKAVKYGVRLGIFLLGHVPGACGNPAEGITEEGWKKVTETVTALLAAKLEDACLYIEDWTPDKKFQARFETYIAYAELL